MRNLNFSVLAVVLAAPVLLHAMTIEDLVPGKTVNGPKLAVADMKGKVVLVEYWGTH
jgi:hypothetical protein